MNLEQRIRRAAESILENEAIRGGMDDDGANALLEWGTQCAQNIATATADLEDDLEAEESVYPRMKALRKMLGAIQKLSAPELETARENDLWRELTRQAAVVYGRSVPELAELQTSAIDALKHAPSGEKLRRLREMLETKLT